jgi:hypothetical protein
VDEAQRGSVAAGSDGVLVDLDPPSMHQGLVSQSVSLGCLPVFPSASVCLSSHAPGRLSVCPSIRLASHVGSLAWVVGWGGVAWLMT